MCKGEVGRGGWAMTGALAGEPRPRPVDDGWKLDRHAAASAFASEERQASPERTPACLRDGASKALAVNMEQFAVAHTGSLNIVHTVNFSSSAVDIAREARIAVTVIALGWVAVTVTRGLFGGFGYRRE